MASSDSDSDCELYTKTAERVQFKSSVGDIEEVINLVDDENEVVQIMQEVDAGMTPMAALLKVQIDNITKENALIASSKSNVSTQPSVDINMFDGSRELCKVIKKDAITTRVSTRASTRASTMASLAKLNKSLISKKVDVSTVLVDVCTPVINGNDVVQDDVVVIEDQDGAEGLGSIAQGSGRKRGRQSNVNRNASKRLQTATNSSNARVIDTIVFDDDSAYCNTITTPIEFNQNYHGKFSTSPNNSVDSSFSLHYSVDSDEDFSENVLVKITIEWTNSKGMTRKDFQLRKFQKFESVFEDLAKLEGISVKRVVLMQQFTSISPTDSPATLNMNFYGALTGYASDIEFSQDKLNLSDADDNTEKKPEGTISLKVQMESKETFVFNLEKNRKMNTLYLMACEELRCDKSKLRLLFDGEYVSPDDKLSSLDVEDGDVFHAYIKK